MSPPTLPLFLSVSLLLFPQVNCDVVPLYSQKLTASDGAYRDFLGSSVSVDFPYAIIGAPSMSPNYGSAYIFKYDTSSEEWIEKQKLTADDNAYHFGGSVAMYKNYAVVGAWAGQGSGGWSSGAAYVFERDTLTDEWDQSYKLTPNDSSSQDQFGISVDINDDVIIVGSRFDDDLGSQSGSAYIFERTSDPLSPYATWTQVSKLLASDGEAGDYFGDWVKFSIDKIAIVGADYHGTSGACYLFEEDDSGSWSQTAKLSTSDAHFGSRFCLEAAISGNFALVGAYEHDGGRGAVYVFTKDTSGGSAVWSQSQVLSPISAIDDFFGSSIAISGNVAAIGSWGDDIDGQNGAGSLYFFEIGDTTDVSQQWIEISKVSAPDLGSADWFGYSVSSDSGFVFSGAYGWDSSSETNAGAVYVYSYNPTQDPTEIPTDRPSQSPTVTPGPCDYVYDSSDTSSFYRWWSSSRSDHFYTVSSASFTGHSYTYEGVMGKLWNDEQDGVTVSLHRYWTSTYGNHFYTTNWSELGGGNSVYKYEGVEGYIMKTYCVGKNKPLYRYYNPSSVDHFYTTSFSELGNGGHGYTYEGVAGYVSEI